MDKSDYRPAYNLLRGLVKEHGGTMDFLQEGESTGGSWLICVEGKQTYFPWKSFCFHGIDELHVPLKYPTKTYFDYKNELVPNAWEKLLENMKNEVYFISDDDQEFLDDLIDL